MAPHRVTQPENAAPGPIKAALALVSWKVAPRVAEPLARDVGPLVRGPGPRALPDAVSLPDLTTGKRAKDLSIETLRGVAIILMVMGHVIGAQPTSGLKVADDSWYRYLYLTLAPMRLPLFTVISGYVYAMRPVQRDRAGTFLLGKARRLLLPLVSVSTVQYLFSVYGPGVARERALGDIWRIYLYPFDQFWFLQAIALVFLGVFAMELTGLLRSKSGWALCLLVGVALYVEPSGVTFFSIDGWCRLFVFFILGVGLNRFEWLSRGRPSLVVAAAALGVSAVLYQSALLGSRTAGVWMPWATLGCGLGATFLLVRFRFACKPLAVLGGFAFTIYLLHSFGVVAGRVLGMSVLGIEARGVLLVIGLLLGLSLPVVGHRVLEKNKWTRRVFLGLR